PTSDSRRPAGPPHLEVTSTMPLPLASPPPRDADGTLIPLRSWVEQIKVDKNHGAPLSRLHQKGQVIDHGIYLIYVRFDLDHRLICLRPNLVCLIETPANH
ncbi:MAG: hypothetical protein ACRDQ4_27955, partial [Pseudonocardiaceae bacterium]